MKRRIKLGFSEVAVSMAVMVGLAVTGVLLSIAALPQLFSGSELGPGSVQRHAIRATAGMLEVSVSELLAIASSRPKLSATLQPTPSSESERYRLEEAARAVLDLKRDPDERRAILAELTQLGEAAIPQLAKIAGSHFVTPEGAFEPHSFADIRFRFEKGLRITALEELDRRAASGGDVRRHIESVIERQADPTLQFLGEISLRGIEQGRPGKLKRFIAEVL